MAVPGEACLSSAECLDEERTDQEDTESGQECAERGSPLEIEDTPDSEVDTREQERVEGVEGRCHGNSTYVFDC